MTVKLLTEHHLEFLSLKRGCTESSESTLVKIPNCWKSNVIAYMLKLMGKKTFPILHKDMLIILNMTKCMLFPKGQLSKNGLRRIAIIFLSVSFNMSFGCSREPSHRDGSFEYPQHMFWYGNKKNNFQLRNLIWRHVISVRNQLHSG